MGFLAYGKISGISLLDIVQSQLICSGTAMHTATIWGGGGGGGGGKPSSKIYSISIWYDLYRQCHVLTYKSLLLYTHTCMYTAS